MNNTKSKVGMLGAGYILESHASAVKAIDGLVLDAIADISLRRAEQAVERFGFNRAYSSVEDLAKSDCDTVHILTPPNYHLEAAKFLLEAGKSVFIEKPMGLSSEECRELGKLADKKGLRLGINHNFLFLPRYEKLRAAVAHGELGRVNQVSCNWHSELAQLRAGPFDTWMLAAPANLFFELGPHLAAFALDLLGPVETVTAAAAKPLKLPNGETAFQSWQVFGGNDSADFSLSLNTKPGQSDRFIRVRGSGGSAQLDFGRDFYWEERTRSANPMFDSFDIAHGTATQLRATARHDRRQRLIAAVRKDQRSTPFAESILRSVRTFYDSGASNVDRRHAWSFAADAIEVCESTCALAQVGSPSRSPTRGRTAICLPKKISKVLVVGGTGFIGRRLVAELISKGRSVRVMSRSKATAEFAFQGLPVEISEGFHGNRDAAREALKGIETVYHLAKCDGKRWDDYVKGDIEPTRILAEEAVTAGVKLFVYTGTIDSYDSANPRRTITENTPLDPAINCRNLYARSKAACEQLLQEMAREQQLPLVIFRPGIVIGAGAPAAHIGVAQFLNETEVQYWGRGDNFLPLVLVDDVATALAAAEQTADVIGKTFLLISGPSLTARDYVSEFSARSGTKVKTSVRPPWRYWIADAVKEAVKNLIRHPNRRRPSLHDWQCRTHRSKYDSSVTQRILNWHPTSDRDAMIMLGIQGALDAQV